MYTRRGSCWGIRRLVFGNKKHDKTRCWGIRRLLLGNKIGPVGKLKFALLRTLAAQPTVHFYGSCWGIRLVLLGNKIFTPPETGCARPKHPCISGGCTQAPPPDHPAKPAARPWNHSQRQKLIIQLSHPAKRDTPGPAMGPRPALPAAPPRCSPRCPTSLPSPFLFPLPM